jgi:retron-type reverse transcriptase
MQEPYRKGSSESILASSLAGDIVRCLLKRRQRHRWAGRYRPGRSPHQTLNALTVGIQRKRVNWVLDLDVRGFFDAISHDWLVKFIEHRIADRRVVRLIQKWLNAGVLEDGKRIRMEKGTPQGAVASPLLANVYLHYLFDLWADVWRRKVARGDVIVVRYADGTPVQTST